MRSLRLAACAVLFAIPLPAQAPAAGGSRPFGTLREQADLQQQWLNRRMESVLPLVMRAYGVDMWVMPMREYNEDPVFTSIIAPTTFAARRRTIYVFFDRGAGQGVERIALGGSTQGGVFEAVRSTKPISGGGAVAGRQAELWGDEQWQVLKRVIEVRNPRVIAINKSRTFAFADGLSSGEYEGMSEALGPELTRRFRPAEGLAVDFIAARIPEEEAFYGRLSQLVWTTIEEMFSSRIITPGTTRTSDVVWFWRQRINDLGLATWFQPSIEIQRKGVTDAQLGSDPVIQRGDVLHCDVGITALRLNTDTQHNAYVLLPGETDAPAGLKKALANANRLQDILFEEVRPGVSGNEVLAVSLAKMRREGIDGTIYTHPIGMHGHGSGTMFGLWDYQDGVPGRGDHKVTPSMWFSSELQATTPVPEWGGQPVRMAMEEDFILGADGKPRWALKRQDRLHLVR